MGGKRLSKRNPIFFHLAIGIGMMIFLSGCNSTGSWPFHKEPEDGAEFQHLEQVLSSINQGKYKSALAENEEYMVDFQYLEQVLGFIGREKFKSALVENAKLEKYYDDSANRSGDHDRVMRVYARMNSGLLKKVIQDEKNLFIFSKKFKEQDLMMEKLNLKLQSISMLLKAVERLDTENKMLKQQIKDFKEIDLEGGKINADIQK